MDRLNSGEQREKMIPFTVIVGLIVLFLVFCITCLSLTFKGTYTLHYSELSRLDYNVYLKENAWALYNGKKYLGKDLLYVTDRIDYVDAKFGYSFKSDDALDIQYNYYITATVDYQDTDGKDFGADYEEVLLESTKLTNVQNQTFTIDENVKIDFQKFNQIASNFITSTGVTAEANLIVSLYVDVVGSHAEFEKKVSDSAAVTLKIPLVNKTAGFEMDYDLSNSYDETLQYKSTIINNKILFYACIVLAFSDVAAMIFIIAWIIMNRDENTLYKKKLNRILRDYDKYISETVITEKVEDLMKTKSLRIVVIKTFEGLIDVRDNLNVPILYQEEVPGKEAAFYIINDRIGYIYILRAEDLNKNKKQVKEELKETATKTQRKNKKSEEMNEVVVEKVDLPVILEEEKATEVNVEELNESVPQEITEEDMVEIEKLLDESVPTVEVEEILETVESEHENVDEELTEKVIDDEADIVSESTEETVKEKSAKAKAREKNQRYYRSKKGKRK